MEIVPFPVRKALLDQVSPVGGGVDDEVGTVAVDAALQDGLQGGEIVVVGGETQVVDEEDEL